MNCTTRPREQEPVNVMSEKSWLPKKPPEVPVWLGIYQEVSSPWPNFYAKPFLWFFKRVSIYNISHVPCALHLKVTYQIDRVHVYNVQSCTEPYTELPHDGILIKKTNQNPEVQVRQMLVVRGEKCSKPEMFCVRTWQWELSGTEPGL